ERLSKGPDTKDGPGREGARGGRRRRRAGLRVPSDNVPRQAGSDEVATPAPEDPRLAVSVAYAFTNGARGADAEPAPGPDPAPEGGGDPPAAAPAPPSAEPDAANGDEEPDGTGDAVDDDAATVPVARRMGAEPDGGGAEAGASLPPI